jgi:hypothetical protein
MFGLGLKLQIVSLQLWILPAGAVTAMVCAFLLALASGRAAVVRIAGLTGVIAVAATAVWGAGGFGDQVRGHGGTIVQWAYNVQPATTLSAALVLMAFAVLGAAVARNHPTLLAGSTTPGADERSAERPPLHLPRYADLAIDTLIALAIVLQAFAKAVNLGS